MSSLSSPRSSRQSARWIAATVGVIALGSVAMTRIPAPARSTSRATTTRVRATPVKTNQQQDTVLVSIDVWNRILRTGFWAGDPDAPVVIVVFGDFECPMCARFQAGLASLLAERANDVSMLFMPFPLSNHKNAVPAARAAECADAQGRFAQIAQRLFAGHDSLGSKPMVSFAADARVPNVAAFSNCFGSGELTERISAARAIGTELRVTATPSVMINRRRLPVGVVSDSVLRAAIDRALANRR